MKKLVTVIATLCLAILLGGLFTANPAQAKDISQAKMEHKTSGLPPVGAQVYFNPINTDGGKVFTIGRIIRWEGNRPIIKAWGQIHDQLSVDGVAEELVDGSWLLPTKWSNQPSLLAFDFFQQLQDEAKDSFEVVLYYLQLDPSQNGIAKFNLLKKDGDGYKFVAELILSIETGEISQIKLEIEAVSVSPCFDHIMLQTYRSGDMTKVVRLISDQIR